MKKLFLPALLLLAACQNKPLVNPGNSANANNLNRQHTLAGTTRTDSLYGANVHFGANSSDYPASNIGYAMKLARIMNWNYFRINVTTDSNGVPNSSTFTTFVDSAYNAGFGTLVVFGNPDLPFAADNVNNIYTTAEINNFYQMGYAKGHGFATLYQGKFQFLQVYNELESYIPAGLLKQGAFGTGTPTDGENDTKYDMRKYQAYFQYLKGVYSGVKAVSGSIRVGTNYSWIHYGLFKKFATDMLNQGKKLDFMGLDWYNDSEYGTDASHNTTPTNVPMANQAIVRLKQMFPSSLVNQVGLTETGISFGGSPKASDNPNNLTKGGFLTLMHNQYKPNCNFLFYYELFKEPQARGAGSKEAEFGIQVPTNLTPNHLVTDTLSLLH